MCPKESECLRNYAVSRLREIHRASESALQGLLRPIDSRGEANLVSPRASQKVDQLKIRKIAKINSRGEFHEARKAAPAADAMSAGAVSEGCRRRMLRGQGLSERVGELGAATMKCIAGR